jgi:phosphoribosylanthranilate isomerase
VTVVKICGITNVGDARKAAEAGADLLGFNFYPKSPRYVTCEQCQAIVRGLREEYGARAPRCVGIFVDVPATRVRAVLDETGLDLAQLHGAEPLADLQHLSPRAFKAIRPQSIQEAQALAAEYVEAGPIDARSPQLLVDAYHPHEYGGTGLPVDLEIARAVGKGCRLMLAGGLTPENVGAVVKQVGPWGVDVSSGVEREKGRKDHEKVRAFVQAVRLETQGEQ